MVDKEITITNEHLKFLDDLRESGVVNMFGSSSYLEDTFDLTRREAGYILQQWMETYGQRLPIN